MELCESVRPGYKSRSVHGCIREKGHPGLHTNGQNVCWLRSEAEKVADATPPATIASAATGESGMGELSI